MSDIFISYAREDRQHAATLATALQERGFSVWWDRQIPPGRPFDQTIEEAIRDASSVVVLWSHQSITSRWVRNEAALGLARGILVPVFIEDVTPPLAFFDIQGVRLVGWSPEVEDADFGHIVHTLRNIVHKSIAPAGSPILSSAQGEQTRHSEERDSDELAIAQPHWFFPTIQFPTGEKLLLRLLVVEVVASWLLIAAPLALMLGLRGSSGDGAEILATLLFWLFSAIGLLAAIWLGAAGWSQRLGKVVAQGWILPPLGVGLSVLAILVIFGLANQRYSPEVRAWLIVPGAFPLPVLLTIGAYRTLPSIRTRHSAERVQTQT